MHREMNRKPLATKSRLECQLAFVGLFFGAYRSPFCSSSAEIRQDRQVLRAEINCGGQM